MKTRTLITLAFATVLAGTWAISAAAAADWTMKADIPFAFQVGSTRMPAGVYNFSRYNNNGVLLIRSANGEVTLVTNGSPLDASRTGISPRVIFNSYGDRCFMRRVVLGGGYSMELPKSKLEAEYQASGGGFTPVEAAAVR